MASITTTTELKDMIRVLEDRRDADADMLKEEFSMFVTSLRPANLIKSSVSGIASSQHGLRNVIIALTGLAVAYFTRRRKKKSKNNMMRKLLATIIQAGIGSLLAVKGEDIKERVFLIFKSIFSKKREEEYI